MRYLILTILIAGCFSSCTEAKVELPPATLEGKDILGCLVNGEVFIAQHGAFGQDHLSISVSKNELNLGGRAFGYDTEVDGNIYIYISQNFNVWRDKVIPLKAHTKQTGEFLNSNGEKFLTGQDKYVGELTITKLDTVNFIVAGTFWFDAVSETGEVVEIRKGRFDIPYSCCTQYPDSR